jgi:hypothetical protein
MALYPEDKRAAFVGLIVTTIGLLIVALTVVELTNRSFEGHEKGAKSTQTTH